MRIKIQIDKQRAKYLLQNAKLSIERLEETNKEKYPTHTIIDYYTIIQYILESYCYKEGIGIEGEGKHKELIKIAKEEKLINSKEEIFLQQLRDFRNRIHYEGLVIKKEYIEYHEEKINSIIRKLLQKNENLTKNHNNIK